MTDARFKKLAKLLIEYSTELKKGDRVLFDLSDVPDEMAVELIRAALTHQRLTPDFKSSWKFYGPIPAAN
jgi:leucyl aminopeptidase (aminopeptidase T)